MPTQRKLDVTAKLTETLSGSQGTVVIEYRGLNVADISALRRKLRDQDVELHVTKNTLLRRAAVECGVEGFEPLFVGPTAIATCSTDEIAPARAMAEAARAPRTPLVIKGGIYSKRGVSAADIQSIAEIPSRPILLSKAVGVTQAPTVSALGVVHAAMRQVLNAANALHAQREAA